jgi:hypothetical protein
MVHRTPFPDGSVGGSGGRRGGASRGFPMIQTVRYLGQMWLRWHAPGQNTPGRHRGSPALPLPRHGSRNNRNQGHAAEPLTLPGGTARDKEKECW